MHATNPHCISKFKYIVRGVCVPDGKVFIRRVARVAEHCVVRRVSRVIAASTTARGQRHEVLQETASSINLAYSHLGRTFGKHLKIIRNRICYSEAFIADNNIGENGV